jgi:hypothetical protein
MNKLKALFSPRALAATAGTAMLLHAALAWADTNCLSRPVSNAAGCGGSLPSQCSEAYSAVDGTQGSFGCTKLYTNPPWGTFYWCCPQGETCGKLGGLDDPFNPAFWGWCQCAGGG